MEKWIAVRAQLAIVRESREHRWRLLERIATAVLGAGELVNPNLVRNRDVVRAKGVGGVQRHVGLPPLGIGVRMGDLGTRMRAAATLELTGPDARQRVEAHVPRLRRLCARVLRLSVLRSRQPGRLRKSNVERATVGSLVRYRPFEHLSTLFILVEAELDECADPAAALRRAVDDSVFDPIAQRIYHIAVVSIAQEGVKVTGRRKT